jgi:hypothetical protein
LNKNYIFKLKQESEKVETNITVSDYRKENIEYLTAQLTNLASHLHSPSVQCLHGHLACEDLNLSINKQEKGSIMLCCIDLYYPR